MPTTDPTPRAGDLTAPSTSPRSPGVRIESAEDAAVPREEERNAIVTDGAESRAVTAAAEEIRSLASRATLAFACEVGRIILDRFYGGDAALWRARRVKPTSIRRLAELLQDGARLSAPALCRCVQTYLLLRRLGPDRRWAHVLPGHVHAVLSLPWPEQGDLLLEAEAGRWSTRETSRAAAVRRGLAAPETDRRRTRMAQAVRRLARLTREHEAALADQAPSELLDEARFEQIQLALVASIERLERVLDRMRASRERLRRGDEN